MRVVVLGYHEIGRACLEVLLKAGDEVTALYTHADDSPGWSGSASPAELAERHGIPVHRPEDINQPSWIEAIRRDAPDVIFSFYYRKLVCEEILQIPRLAAMNLHGSFLPHYRGRCPVNWVLVHGESETGVTLHYMVKRADAGEIVAQRRVPIDIEDTALTLYRRITSEAVELLRTALPSIRDGSNARIPQKLEEGSCFGGRRAEDGEVDWRRPASDIYNLVRAVTHPYPGAFTHLHGRKLYIWAARPDSANPGARSPGSVLTIDGALAFATGDGVLRILRGQFEGQPEADGTKLLVGAMTGSTR